MRQTGTSFASKSAITYLVTDMENKNGGYRKACTQDSCDSDQGAGGADTGAAAACTPIKTVSAASSDATENTREGASIRVGEITAWRCWVMAGDTLHSVIMGNKWPVQEPLEASYVSHRFGDGIHAFKTEWCARIYSLLAPEIIVGKVSLWGEVWEFDKGYHAEFAKIKSLEYIPVSAVPLASLILVTPIIGIISVFAAIFFDVFPFFDMMIGAISVCLIIGAALSIKARSKLKKFRKIYRV